jgi:hypothetical protein
MSKNLVLAASASLLMLSGALPLSISAAFGEIPAPQKLAFTIGKPVESGNLTVFFIKGNDDPRNQSTITLQEALAKEKVRVNETGNVNNLEIENLSDSLVFIQSGDIVKGGRQDRTMQYDMILPPHSGKVPLPAFCVEHGRWSGRGSERQDKFSNSEYALPGKELKLAARQAGDQQEVWKKVADSSRLMYEQAAACLPCPPLAAREFEARNASGSLELALENKQVNAVVEEQVKKLSHVVDGDNKIIGFAFAVNGKLSSADVYGSNRLFLKMWPKELKSAVVEAVENKNVKAKRTPIDAVAVKQALENSEKARVSRERMSNTRTVLLDHEGKDDLTFETIDKSTGAFVHKSYFVK